ncbi:MULTISPECIES: ATP-binding protein [Flavobacterium]|uniref:ATP-binding protein n=1 Tax=Flavobacterium quisquiliarum TaxID=1834436 RepID=A0ABV8VY14_9FLAO
MVHNALKLSKAEVPPRVAIACGIIEDEQGDWMQISIEDNGIGLNDADSERIFTSFDCHHSKDQYEGSGV